jgi:hypothetical protein
VIDKKNWVRHRSQQNHIDEDDEPAKALCKDATPREPFFAYKDALHFGRSFDERIIDPEFEDFHMNKNEYIYNTLTEEIYLTRAALLRLILHGYQVPFRWWVLAAEAVKGYEARYGYRIKTPNRTLPLKEEDRILDLYGKNITEQAYLLIVKQTVAKDPFTQPR